MRVPPDDVVKAAQDAQRATGVPASVSIGQWALESAWGARCTGRFNFFGVKAVGDQPHSLCWTHEVVGGKSVSVQQPFRDYASLDEAFSEHARLLTRPRYSAALAALAANFSLHDYVASIAPVYATDPHYADNLFNLIAVDGFARFDLPNLGKPA